LKRVGFVGGRVRADVVHAERLPRERRRVRRIRLRRPALLAGMSDFGTGRSSIGQIGSPVTRSNT
jgi:hypothetical protein